MVAGGIGRAKVHFVPRVVQTLFSVPIYMRNSHPNSHGTLTGPLTSNLLKTLGRSVPYFSAYTEERLPMIQAPRQRSRASVA